MKTTIRLKIPKEYSLNPKGYKFNSIEFYIDHNLYSISPEHEVELSKDGVAVYDGKFNFYVNGMQLFDNEILDNMSSILAGRTQEIMVWLNTRARARGHYLQGIVMVEFDDGTLEGGSCLMKAY